MTTKLPYSDYLKGQTARCEGFGGSKCRRRVLTVEAKLCNECAIAKNHQEFKDALAKPGPYWFLEWVFYCPYTPEGCKAFVCRTCGDRKNAKDFGVPNSEGVLIPATACCTETLTCKAAEEFWGKDYNFTYLKMCDYVAAVRQK